MDYKQYSNFLKISILFVIIIISKSQQFAKQKIVENPILINETDSILNRTYRDSNDFYEYFDLQEEIDDLYRYELSLKTTLSPTLSIESLTTSTIPNQHISYIEVPTTRITKKSDLTIGQKILRFFFTGQPARPSH